MTSHDADPAKSGQPTPDKDPHFPDAEHQGRLFDASDIGQHALQGPPTDGVHGIDAFPDMVDPQTDATENDGTSELERRIIETEHRRQAIFDLDSEFELRTTVNNVERRIRGLDRDMLKVPVGDAHISRRQAISAKRKTAEESKDTLGHQIREKIRNAKVSLGRSIGIEASRVAEPITDDEGNIVYQEQPDDQKGKIPPKPKTRYVVKTKNPTEQPVLDRAFDEFYKQFSRNGDPKKHDKRTEEIERLNGEIRQLDPEREIPIRPIDAKKAKAKDKAKEPVTGPITQAQLEAVQRSLKKTR